MGMQVDEGLEVVRREVGVEKGEETQGPSRKVLLEGYREGLSVTRRELLMEVREKKGKH